MPESLEKLSHGEPTFFARNRVYAMFANDHHHPGRVAVYVAARPGLQEALVAEAPEVYFRPPYVGGRGWIGINLGAIDDEALAAHLLDSLRLVTAAGACR